jgi:hypothetical protein
LCRQRPNEPRQIGHPLIRELPPRLSAVHPTRFILWRETLPDKSESDWRRLAL